VIHVPLIVLEKRLLNVIALKDIMIHVEKMTFCILQMLFLMVHLSQFHQPIDVKNPLVLFVVVNALPVTVQKTV
jgi:hypothetical protein